MYTIQVFIAIACNPGISVTEIAELVDIAQPSATRAVVLLAERSDRHAAEQEGRDALGYVELYQDEFDRRRTLCRLTRRGVLFWRTLSAIMGEQPFEIVPKPEPKET
jgi:DNA-binding MarR family transcriptional regulator